MIWTHGSLSASLSAAVLTVGVLGCASTPSWRPGDPDASTTEHYQLAQAAIEARNQHNADAALELLSNDVSRMETNTATQAAALSDLHRVKNAVTHQNWDDARDRLLKWNASYGRR